MSSHRDTARLRHGLTQLRTTALGGVSNFLSPIGAPMSAITMNSAHPFSARSPAPPSTLLPYNPQEWAYPYPIPDRPPVFPEDAQPPPPPYSPPRSSPTAPTNLPPNTPVIRAPPPQITNRPLPESQQNTQFPPPPPPPSSRDRRFALPSFGRRGRDHDQPPPSSTDSTATIRRGSAFSRPSPVLPLTIQIPTSDTLSNVVAPDSSISNPSNPTNPPAARRTASAGPTDTPTSRSTSMTRWPGPGSDVPPPPPPQVRPPAQSRSQSTDSPVRPGRDHFVLPRHIVSLDPVPSTPRGWTDEPDARSSPARPDQDSLVSNNVDASTTSDSIPTSGTRNPSESTSPSSVPSTTPSSLSRAPAVRHDKTVVSQRRAEFRNSVVGLMQEINDAMPLDSSASPPPSSSDGPTPGTQTRPLVLAGAESSKSESSPDEALGSSHSSTPRAGPSATTPKPAGSKPPASWNACGTPATSSAARPVTPPFSPRLVKPVAVATTDPAPITVPKALPTPPPHSRSASSSHSRVSGCSFGQCDTSTSSPALLLTKHMAVSQTAEQFSQGSVERCREFARREAAAQDDAERVRLFAEFMVSESRIRRERYSAAIAAMGTEILDLTRDLFRPMAPSNSRPSYGDWTPHPSDPSRSHRGSISSVAHLDQGHQLPTPQSAETPQLPSPAVGLAQTAASTTNVNRSSTGFMPSLSPILSQSVSDNFGDEQDSRGRPASRWWEVMDSNNASSRHLERTDKENKYMGLPRVQWTEVEGDDKQQRKVASATPAALTLGGRDGSALADGASANAAQGSDSAMSRHPDSLTLLNSGGSGTALTKLAAATVPGATGLDISRLINLPPPYPRHHPAVNNNHPELAIIRSTVRTISDLSEVTVVKEKFLASSKAMREQHHKAAEERQQALARRLRQNVASGSLTYAGAAAFEQEAEQADRDLRKDLEKRDYEQFQAQVVTPLHELLMGRIERATRVFDELAGRLSDPVESAADAVQEEGDDKPELLEKLTLLKWIFEARETLHRAVFDLLSERNDRYREVILTPYRLAGNTEKMRSAERFFADDEARRQLEHSKAVLERARGLRTIVDQHVVRGVEAQLSAFWDIAPSLSNLLDKIPTDLAGFAIRVPADELVENPAYGSHPLQYLFSLVAHAEKSTYQFIEAQTNLLCLLHEVREAVTHAKAKVWDREPPPPSSLPLPRPSSSASPTPPDELVRLEERRLTDDLKERVRDVQGQWRSALGDNLAGVKERVGEWLLQTGGWDEALEEAGVGVA